MKKGSPIKKTKRTSTGRAILPPRKEVVQTGTFRDSRQAGFYTSSATRLQVLILHDLGGYTYRQIAQRVGIYKQTVLKIVNTAPEKGPLQRATRAAGGLELFRVIPQAVETLRIHIEKEKSLKASLALLRGLQLLFSKSEVIEEKQDPFENRTAEELQYFIKHLEWPTPEQLEECKQEAKKEK